jgi:hypothetical protein
LKIGKVILTSRKIPWQVVGFEESQRKVNQLEAAAADFLQVPQAAR